MQPDPRSEALDMQRAESMADEGGCSGAAMESEDRRQNTRLDITKPHWRIGAAALTIAASTFLIAGVLVMLRHRHH
jgi:hypothetical protein